MKSTDTRKQINKLVAHKFTLSNGLDKSGQKQDFSKKGASSRKFLGLKGFINSHIARSMLTIRIVFDLKSGSLIGPSKEKKVQILEHFFDAR